MIELETERLILREILPDDAEFMLGLLNEPSFLQFIGDRQVRTADDARRYIADGPTASYAANGFGLLLVERRTDGSALGICGLLRRETLPEVDIGFAFLPAYWGCGYAREAAVATLGWARDVLGIARLVAITSPDNTPSIALLGRLGFTFTGWVRLADDAPEIRLFSMELQRTPAMPA